jgi:hypothetical protein
MMVQCFAILDFFLDFLRSIALDMCDETHALACIQLQHGDYAIGPLTHCTRGCRIVSAHSPFHPLLP